MAKLILSEIVVSVARNYFDSPAETALSSSDIYERSSLIIEEYFCTNTARQISTNFHIGSG